MGSELAVFSLCSLTFTEVSEAAPSPLVSLHVSAFLVDVEVCISSSFTAKCCQFW
jgi:hypothetical protein